MRDKIKNKEYFESIITQKKENISFYLNALKNNRVAIDSMLYLIVWREIV